MNNFRKYLFALLKKWILYLGLLPTLLGYTVYLPEPYNLLRIPYWINISILMICFIIASFPIWLEEHLEKEKLKEKINALTENDVDFEIEFKYLELKKADIDYADKEIEFAKNQILKKQQNNVENLLPPQLKHLRQLAGIQPRNINEVDVYDWEKYIKQLEEWKVKGYEFNDFIEQAGVYNINITNISYSIDKKINLKINNKENLKFLDFLPDKYEIPNKPMHPYFNNPSLLSSLQSGPRKIYYENAPFFKRRFYKDILDIEIDELRVQESYNEIFLINFDTIEECHLEIEIRSEKTKKPIFKNFSLLKRARAKNV